VCHRESMCCGVHGRIADGVRGARTVGAHRRLFHGRPRTGRAGGPFLAWRAPLSRAGILFIRPAVSEDGRREGGALIAGPPVRESVTAAGRSGRGWPARSQPGVIGPGTRAVLTPRCSGASCSAAACGTVGRGSRRDRHGQSRGRRCSGGGHRPQRPRVPELRPADSGAEGSRGLQLVAGIAARWAWRRRGRRTVPWSGLSHGWHLRLTAAHA